MKLTVEMPALSVLEVKMVWLIWAKSVHERIEANHKGSFFSTQHCKELWAKDKAIAWKNHSFFLPGKFVQQKYELEEHHVTFASEFLTETTTSVLSCAVKCAQKVRCTTFCYNEDLSTNNCLLGSDLTRDGVADGWSKYKLLNWQQVEGTAFLTRFCTLLHWLFKQFSWILWYQLWVKDTDGGRT